MVYDSTFHNNRAEDDGGGASDSILVRCQLVGNTAGNVGGGADYCKITNSLVAGNRAAEGGGINSCTVAHGTICGNTGTRTGGLGWADHVWNSIMYHNVSLICSVWDNFNTDSSRPDFHNCCTYPETEGCITNEPAFLNLAAGDFRLRYGSPCIDAVTNLTVSVLDDLTGMKRPLDGDFDLVAVSDLGAYEYNPASYDTDGDGIPDGWEHTHGLNLTNAADAVLNPDGDPHNNLQEYIADTNPTNALSYLRIVAFSNLPPWTVWFAPSSTNRRYTLEFSTNLIQRPWPCVPGQFDVPGLGGVQSLNDTNTDLLRFCRVGVRP